MLNVMHRPKCFAGSACTQCKSLTDFLMNVVYVQPVLCAEPFYGDHWDLLTPSCPTASRTNVTAAASSVPRSPANRIMLHDTEAANPSLSHLAQIPEPNYSSLGTAWANQSHGEAPGSHPHHGWAQCKFSLQSSKMLPAASTEGEEETCAGESL